MRFRLPGSRLYRLARRLRGDRRGSAAVEFALVAPVFFALLFAIIETALVFFAGQLLETATQDSARLILTGQQQTSGLGKAQTIQQSEFKNQVCARLSSIFDCANGIYIDVQSYSSFSGQSMNPPIDSSKNFVTSTQYNPGTAGQVVIVRVYYQWQLFVTGLGYDISNLSGSKRLLVGTAVFRNEPYS